jgi:hypothetical protein
MLDCFSPYHHCSQHPLHDYMGVPAADRSVGRVIRSYGLGFRLGPVSASTDNALITVNQQFILILTKFRKLRKSLSAVYLHYTAVQ